MKKAYIIVIVVVLLLAVGLTALLIINNNTDRKTSESLINIQLNKTEIIFQHNGLSEFIEITGINSDGETVNLTWTATKEISDQDVVIVIGDRVISRGSGLGDIQVTIGDYETTISVEVLSDLDLESVMQNKISESSETKGLTAAEREAIISKASAMYNVEWSPTQTFSSFDNMFTYETDKTYNIPYSQTANQVDEIKFKEIAKSGDFYSSYKRYLSPYKRRIVMPKYGSDCSGFVSFSWGVQRESTATFVSKIIKGKYPKIGSYDPENLTYSDLLNSYSHMLPGDAVVRYGHVILIAENHSDFAYCYEQIGLEIELTYWTHSDLASRGYMPFSRE